MGAGKGTTLTIDLPLTVMRRSTDTDVPGAHPLAMPQQVKFSEQASISVSVERTNCKSQEQSANR